LSKDGTI